MVPSTAPVMSNKRSGQNAVSESQKRVKAVAQAPEDESIYVDTTTALKTTSSGEHVGKPCGKIFEENDSTVNTKHSHSSASQPSLGLQHDTRASVNSILDTPTAQKGLDNNSSEIASDHPASPDEEHHSFHSDTSDDYVPYDYDDDGSVCTPVTSFDDLNKELGRWAAPQEPLRPKNPYKKGRILEMKKHNACPPFGSDYPIYEGERERAYERELRGKTLVELCLDRPPIGGEIVMDQEPETLEILEEIRTGDKSGPQIVVCRFSAGREEVVAKIYDPLYYGFANRMWSDQPRDVTYEADLDYAREVAAYCELDDQLGGTYVPKYHGSWTFQLPLDLPEGQKTRDVRLVLMEHIKGRTMIDLKPESFPESARLDMVTGLIEADSQVKFAGVSHGDVSQRNVMVCLTEEDVVERVVMIDFNFAVVDRLDNIEQRLEYMFPDLEVPKPDPKPDKPRNPIDRWFSGSLWGLAGEWLPESWECRLRASQEWLYEKYGKSEEYAPPREELDWDEENVPRLWIGF